MDVLEDMSEGQINLASEAARKTIANSIIAAIKTNEKGWFLDIGDLDGKTKFTKEELETQRYKEYWTCGICGKDTSGVDYDYLGSGTNHLGCELEEGFQKITKDRREKNWSQKKHEEKVFPGIDAIQKQSKEIEK